MKILLRAAIMAASFASIGSAYAGGYQARSAATAQNGQSVQAYVTQSDRGTWLFQGNQNQGANS